MGIFNKKRSIPRRELRSVFGKHSGRIPGTGGKRYYRGQREKMARDVFGPKYGSEISKHDYRGALRELKSSRGAAKDRKARAEIDKKIRYLGELGGKNI